MKKTTFTFFFALFVSSLFAQSDKYTKKVAQETCDCLSKEEIEPFTREKYEKVLVKCLFSADELNESMKENKLDLSKGQDAGRDLGMKIGLKMIELDCKSYLDYSLKLVEEQNADKAVENEENNVTYGIFEGLDKSGDFAYFIVKDEAGRTYKFMWQEYFEGSELFMAEPLDELIGKEIEVGWYKKEVYLPRLNDYFMVKIIQTVNID